MENLGAKEAAARIRGVFFSDRSSRVDPEQAHQLRFAKEVCKELGADDSPETVQHVMQLLREHDVALHAGHEYPKFATRKWDRTSRIVNSESEEQQWVDEPEPAPTDPGNLLPLRTLEAPVQDLSLDLRDKVPHMVDDMPAAERLARVPSSVTNREAAQDAYARQSFEDHGHSDDDGVHFEEVDDNTLAPNADKLKGGATYAKAAEVGVMAHDDPDRDGVAGQDVNPTHDSVLGTGAPQSRSDDSSAGKVDNTGRRPVGTGKNPNKRPI